MSYAAILSSFSGASSPGQWTGVHDMDSLVSKSLDVPSTEKNFGVSNATATNLVNFIENLADNITLVYSAPFRDLEFLFGQLSMIVHRVKEEKKIDGFFKELNSLNSLSDNWDSYGSPPPNNYAIYWSSQILQVLSEKVMVPTALCPSTEGGVAIVFQNNEKYADFEIFNTGEILAVISDPNEDQEVWEFTTEPGEIDRAIDRVDNFLRN